LNTKRVNPFVATIRRKRDTTTQEAQPGNKTVDCRPSKEKTKQRKRQLETKK